MGISIAEFRVAMETYGAKRLPDMYGSRYFIPVPCFAVGEYVFLHSGTYYIVQRGRTVSEFIMDRAMAEFGEVYPGGDNFWYGETHSVKGVLTLAAMLEGKYSKEWVDELTNKTYKKLLESSLIHENVEFPFTDNHSQKMKELYKKLEEFSKIVNPFSNETLNLKEPIEYLNRLKISIAVKENEYVKLTLSEKLTENKFEYYSSGWDYETEMFIRKNGKNSCIYFGHYYRKGDAYEPEEEIIRLKYRANSDSYDNYPEDISLSISLKNEFAWPTYKKEMASPVTDEQIDMMITYMNKCIKRIKQRIICYMIKK